MFKNQIQKYASQLLPYIIEILLEKPEIMDKIVEASMSKFNMKCVTSAKCHHITVKYKDTVIEKLEIER